MAVDGLQGQGLLDWLVAASFAKIFYMYIISEFT